MNLIEALKALDEGDKIRRKTWTAIEYIQLDKDRKLVDNLGQEMSFLCTSDDVGTDCWEVIERTPLTDREREYLKAVVKPFRDRVNYIRKGNDDEDNAQYILITVKKYGKGNEGITEYIDFPYFEEGTMYVNMKVNKNYTLEELGL